MNITGFLSYLLFKADKHSVANKMSLNTVVNVGIYEVDVSMKEGLCW